jgi:hypothetical protein
MRGNGIILLGAAALMIVLVHINIIGWVRTSSFSLLIQALLGLTAYRFLKSRSLASCPGHSPLNA